MSGVSGMIIPSDTQRRRVYAPDSRPSDVVTIGGAARGSVATDRIVVTRFGDTALYDRMHDRAQISDRQHAAAERLAHMWTAAGLNPRVCASIEHIDHDEKPLEEPQERAAADPEAPTARDIYRRLMRSMAPAHAVRLDALLLGEHPGVRWLATLQAALGDLADRWRIA